MYKKSPEAQNDFTAILQGFRAYLEDTTYAFPEALPFGSLLGSCQEQVRHCSRCQELAAKRTQTVFGAGNPLADLMFIGEAPGQEEDQQGIPFVGRAGQLLTKMLAAISLRRDQVYIANILKCRPPGNRDPYPEETGNCWPFLEKQIQLIRPRIICTLGRPASQWLLQSQTPISRLRGRLFSFRGIIVLPTFHPSYLLRNESKKREAWHDLKLLRKKLDELS